MKNLYLKIRTTFREFINKPDSDNEFIEVNRARINFVHILPSCIIAVLIQSFDFIINSVNHEHFNHYDKYVIYSWVMIIFCVLFFISWQYIYHHSSKSCTSLEIMFSRIFWCGITLCGLTVSSFDLIQSKNINCFFTLIVGLSVGPVCPLPEACPLIIFCVVWQTAAILLFGLSNLFIGQAILSGIFSLCISQMLYSGFFESQLAQIKLKHSNALLKKLSLTDELTGLLNRRGFADSVYCCSEHSMKNQSKIILIILDIDFFKAYNDKFGHWQGDQCLKRVSSCIIKNSLSGVQSIARYGGEEFTILAEVSDSICPLQMSEMAKRLLTSVKDLKLKSGNSSVSPYVTVSIGMWQQQITKMGDFETLFKKADLALYQAKSDGRNQINFGNVEH